MIPVNKKFYRGNKLKYLLIFKMLGTGSKASKSKTKIIYILKEISLKENSWIKFETQKSNVINKFHFCPNLFSYRFEPNF